MSFPAEPKVTMTLQVEFNGTRLTSHYEMQLGELVFTEVTSNVPHVDVLLVQHMMLLQKAFERDR